MNHHSSCLHLIPSHPITSFTRRSVPGLWKMLVIFFTYWAGMFLQGAESNVSVDIDILQWVVVVPNAMFVVVIVVIALRGASISKVP